MVIARKLLTPSLFFFAILLVGVITYLAVASGREMVSEEQRYLLSQQQALQDELKRLADVSLALSKQTVSNPLVRQAFAEGNREQLLSLTRDGFRSAQNVFRVYQQRFTQAPAQVILDFSDIDKYGQDLSAKRLTLVAANTLQIDVSSLEMAEDGLAMRGVAPFEVITPDGSRIRGSLETSLRFDQRLFNDLRTKYGGDWQLLLLQSAMDKAGYVAEKTTPNTQAPELIAVWSTLPNPFFNEPQAYQQALRGQVDYVYARVHRGPTLYAMLTLPLRDYTGQIVGVVDILWDRSAAQAQLVNRTIFSGLAGLSGLLFIGFVLSGLIGNVLLPVQELTRAAQDIAEGKLNRPLPELSVEERNVDEVEQLNRSFHRMTEQLRELVGNLEELVAERTQTLEQRSNQMQAAAEVASQVARLTQVEDLLTQAVNLIRQRFDFYHAGVFLTDESGQYAVLRAATGEAGRQMLETGHRLRVGQVGLVGAAIGNGQPQVSPDVELDPLHYKNPLLPETRSEVALPLRVGETVIGALDVQSRQVNAFDPAAITTLQLVADQLAAAINNARLIEALNRTVAELEEAHGRMTQQSWREFLRGERRPSGYRYLAGTAAPSPVAEAVNLYPLSAQDAPSEAQEAIRKGQPVWRRDTSDGVSSVLAMPIRLRGEVIGAVHLRFDAPVLQDEVINLVEEATSRLALIMESTRLLQQAQRLAAREQQINLIATEMRNSVNLEVILQNTVRELGKAVGARRAFIQIGATEDSTGRSRLGLDEASETHLKDAAEDEPSGATTGEV